LHGGFKDQFLDQDVRSPHRNRDRQLDNQADEGNGTRGMIMNALSRGDLPRPRAAGWNGSRKNQFKAHEAVADRRDLEFVAAMDHNAGRQRVDAHANNAGALPERPPQCREIVILPLPPRDFDANSLRRPVDHEGPASCIHGCSSEDFRPASGQSYGRHLDAVKEIMMTIRWCVALEPTRAQ
jgi:hypothetical protein